MLNEKWKRLQNGSDIRGIAMEGVTGENVNLTPQIAEVIAKAFAIWLSGRTGKTTNDLHISIGRDSRLSGPALSDAVLNGLSQLGCTVYDCSLASTPAMFMSTVMPGFCYDGAIMLTASHLPFNRNGLKFFTPKGGLEKTDITALLEIAQENAFDVSNPKGSIHEADLISAYAANLVEMIRNGANDTDNYDTPLKGLRILVDAGNGAGGFFVSKVLEPLGADTSGSQFLDPDGSFPNHVPNPEDTEAIQAAQKAVLDSGADFGIMFDTDVDRAGAVDRNGKEINRNRIIALMAAIVLEEHPSTTIVTDSITSKELKWFIEAKLGGIHHRFKRGYKNVINEAIRLNSEGRETHLAIETSGHGALKENYFLDDGAYLIAKTLIKIAKLKREGKTIDTLLADLKDPLESSEFRMNILENDFKAYGTKVIDDLAKHAKDNPDWHIAPDNHEGIRISFDENSGNGWLLLRLSLHDPLLPLNIESNTPGGVKLIASMLATFLADYPGLDILPLKSYIV